MSEQTPEQTDIPELAMTRNMTLAESDIRTWAAGVRESFGRNRKDFNFAVCDAMAAAGIQPTGRGVLRLGKWGQQGSVNQDVAEWYKTLADRLKSAESNIPLSARRHANALLDQLFSVARTTMKAEFDAQLAPLNEQLGQTQQLLNESIEAEGALKLECQRLQAELARERSTGEDLKSRLEASGNVILGLKDQIDAGITREAGLQQQINALNEAQRELERTAERAQAQYKQELSTQDAAHATKLLAAQQTADTERRRLMLEADAARTEQVRQVKLLQGELDGVRQRLEAANVQNAHLSGQLATAQASLTGANDLLASERRSFSAAEANFKSNAYRHESLLSFVRQARKAGITLSWLEAPGEDAIAGLSHLLGADKDFSAKLGEIIPIAAVVKSDKS